MSRPFPYAYISCPCANTPVPDPSRKRRSRESPQKSSPEKPRVEPEIDDDEDEQTFDPRSTRSNFSLYPPEQLLYCEDCHQIKCPRCITEEIICWFCPNCLFETPSSMVRGEGNRCGRNCYACPVCTAALTVSTIDTTGQQGPWVLACSYCMWTTLDIGIKFDKPTNVRNQITKILADAAASALGTPRTRQMSKTFGELKSPLSTYSSIDEQLPLPGESGGDESSATQAIAANGPLTPDAHFAALKNFYKGQLAAVNAASSDPLGDFSSGFSSPGAINRLMSIYASSSRLSGLYGGSGKKPKPKPPVMREALNSSEGLSIPAPDCEASMIQRMVSDDCGWDGLASIEQRADQSPDARFVEDLFPKPILLRTRRSKRCKSCKHILVKPESKPASTRFRIRLIALSYIPLPTMRPLILPPSSSSSSSSAPSSLLSTSPSNSPAPNLDALPPLKPIQLLLTLKNHMFDAVRVTLATPSVTPGRVASKVTILCPQFDIGANSDVWDEALQAAAAAPDQRSSRGAPYEKVAEAGKVWEKGRNWTTVVLEVVPGTLPGRRLPKGTGTTAEESSEIFNKTTKNDDDDDEEGDKNSNDDDDDDDDDDDSESKNDNAATLDWSGQAKDPSLQLQPDEDILEIPVFVRMEWDSDNQIEHDQAVPAAVTGRGSNADTVKRELAYWMVLGVGRIQS
ncbi:hypothetical protein ARAM_007303 [Aspergillus rambellii]|uniref:Dynactin subunit 4 n=1 Tax=Aspergillus rambellii TaxID=308745 RepID=A0A0F8UN50_9EURO|nr:hypothetical protein ARAM_007303 [Aspergillus rambellii]